RQSRTSDRMTHWCVMVSAHRMGLAAAAGFVAALLVNGASLAESEIPEAAAGLGVRPLLKAALSLDPASPYAKSEDGKLKTSLHVAIRISDHAPEADFFGIVGADFNDVKAVSLQPEQFVWQALRCHLNRGLPKVAVTDIRGTIADGETKVQVLA